MISLQAAQTSLNAVHDVAARGPDVIAPRADAAVDLGRNHDMLPRDLEVLQRLSEDLFALALRIDIRGIEEVDPALNRCLDQLIGSRLTNGSDGFEHSSAVPEGHGSEAQFRDQETRIAEGCIFHGVFLLLRVRSLRGGAPAFRHGATQIGDSFTADGLRCQAAFLVTSATLAVASLTPWLKFVWASVAKVTNSCARTRSLSLSAVASSICLDT